MIIQKVIRGVGGISKAKADEVFRIGILCNWWNKVSSMPEIEVHQRLTDRNLYWHQNRYADADPQDGGEEFYKHTPFISTTAGSIERDSSAGINVLHPAWLIALEFATDGWTRDAYLFYCYLFVIGKRCVPHRPFSEELRELNVYTGFSAFQPEGEIAAKINIPPTQIEKYAFFTIAGIRRDLAAGRIPTPASEVQNTVTYRPPDEVSNMRDALS
ncbi:MAG: hypothetical protein H7A43_03640 [Verrucomicrobia bacterium]|nr:hypothetical protein [Verrucomicrobiota bacterium]